MALLVGLLALSLVFTSVLAYQAQDAARSHRLTAERALHDYATFAALEFTINAKEGLYSQINSVLYRPADLGVGAPTEYRLPMSLDSAVHHSEMCEDRLRDTAMFFFRLELTPRTIPVSRGCASPAVKAWLLDTIPPHARAVMQHDWDFAHVMALVNGEPQLAAYVVRRDRHGTPVTAYGFTTRYRPFATRVFLEIMEYYPLLPPSLVAGAKNDSVLSVLVTDKNGYVLYRSDMRYAPTYSGTMRTDKSFGGLATTVSLRPEIADQLVIGGLPRSRLPLLLCLLALSVAFVAVALVQLRREYELARLRSDFISSISHELRTPLAQVRMFAETLRLGRVRSDEERRRSLEIIDQEARRLTHLVENILQFSRSERRVTRLSPEPTELASQGRDAIECFAPLALARHVTLRVELADGLVALVDRGALRQTLINLLDNAVKYGPNGQTVTLAMTRQGDAVRITVDDEGPGIEPSERTRIWEPFYRLDRDANSAVAGSGIGLAVVHELVTQQGGRVAVEVSPSGGARFVIELPLLGDAGIGSPRTESSDATAPLAAVAPVPSRAT